MKADYTITVWHFDNNEDAPTRRVLKNVSVSHKVCIGKNGIKQKGFFRNDSFAVRVFTTDDIGVVPGDYICVGEYKDINPVKETCHKVIETRDNRRGGRKHWHIICGG